MKNIQMISAAMVALALIASVPAHAAKLDCKLHFNLSSWSVIYKHASGSGVISCTDGQSMKVNIRANGGGLTVGKSKIKDGVGDFDDLNSINDAIGTYAKADATAGVAKSGSVQVMTKGNVSLSIAGAGSGVDLGVSVGGFTISKAK